jgi:hypothetical protein
LQSFHSWYFPPFFKPGRAVVKRPPRANRILKPESHTPVQNRCPSTPIRRRNYLLKLQGVCYFSGGGKGIRRAKRNRSLNDSRWTSASVGENILFPLPGRVQTTWVG